MERSQAREALGLIKTYGFPCVNVDFIYGVPGQTVTSLLASLKEALTFAPDEIFLYPLYVKHGVRMERAGVVPDAEAAYLQYREASGFLRGKASARILCGGLYGGAEKGNFPNAVWELLSLWGAEEEVT